MGEKIRLAYIAKEMPVNGISNVIMNYCRNLNKNKFEITIFSGVPIAEQYIEECKKLGIKIEKMPPKRGGNPLKYYKYLFDKINSKNFDIVHVHGNSATITIEMIMAWIRGVKVRIAHCHNTTCDKIKSHKLLQPLLRVSYTYGLACSYDAGTWMFGNENFEILPNGFNTEKFMFNSEIRNKIRGELGLSDKFVIGHVGMFNNQKNHPFLIDVFEQIAKNNDKAYLLLIGTGPDFEKTQEKISQSEYKNRIICYGVTSKVDDLYNAMDIFVFPSKHEGLGIVLLEAQINGLPCVTSDVVPKEVKITNNIEMLSLNDGVESWANEILKIDCNKDRNEIYNENITQIEKYNIIKNAQDLGKKYEELVKRRRQ